MESDNEKITISWGEIEQAEDPQPLVSQDSAPHSEEASWGTVGRPNQTRMDLSNSQSPLLMKGWFYLGASGLIGAFLAWMFCEPSFSEGPYSGWGNTWIFPLMVILMSVGFGAAESAIERSWPRALLRGLASVALGLVLGFLFNWIANLLYQKLISVLLKLGAESGNLQGNPAFWLARGTAWAVFGIVGGIIFGIVSRSGKKCVYGIQGGAIGAAIGGVLFDPISLLTGGAEASRAIGMSLVGASTGIAMGLVENAQKDRWLYVAEGPLAGKQFILYQDRTTIGKQQSCIIYLFKDPSILDQHAVIEHRGTRSVITAYGDVVLSGQALSRETERVLTSGDTIQIGRYIFQYLEKQKTGTTA